MKNCILHIPWKVDDEQLATPDIRAKKMFNAFKKIGYNVEVIWGAGKERVKLFKELKKKVDKGFKINFLYSEASTYPTFLTEPHHLPSHPLIDFKIMKFCKKRNIPIGLFYRDVFWNVKHIKRMSTIKHLYSKLFHIYDILVYNKLLDVLFVPHLNIIKYISYLNKNIRKETLYSGTELLRITPILNNKFLYVGGVSPKTYYDVTEMLKAFADSDLELYLCCRKKEWDIYVDFYAEHISKNIHIVHYSHKNIYQLYDLVSYTIVFNPPVLYRKVTTPYKLYEYISYEKPIITSNDTTIAEFVKENDVGYVIDYKAEKLKEFLNNLPSQVEYYRITENMKKVKSENTWSKRAEKVSKLLTYEN